MLLLLCADFFSKFTFLKHFFQEHYQSVKWFGSRSGPMFCLSCSGSKLFGKVIIRRQIAASKERVKNDFFLFQLKHMLWVLKWDSMRQFYNC